MLELLAQGEKSVEALAEQLSIEIKLASAHLKILREVLSMGWLVALPIPAMIWHAPNWNWVVAATVLLGGAIRG